MDNGFKLDTKDFNQTIDKYIKFRNADYLTEVNRRAANIIMKAMQFTKRTDPSKVVSELGATQQVRRLKGGTGRETKAKKNRDFYKGGIAGYKIFNWRRRVRPQSLPPPLRGKGLGGKEMGQKYDSFVKSARRSCAYIVAGWIPALNRYKQQGIKIKSDIKRSPSQRTSAGKGYAIPAQRVGDFLKTTFANSANGVEKVGVKPLQTAIQLEEQDMRLFMEREEQKRLNKLKR
jgi:hypothetical protein